MSRARQVERPQTAVTARNPETNLKIGLTSQMAIFEALWTVISIGDFAIPKFLWRAVSTGSA